MSIELVDIPELSVPLNAKWQVRALVVDGRDPVRVALFNWKRAYPNDYKAIIKVLKLAASQRRVLNQKHVKKSRNKAHGEVFEAIAYTGIARLMFFYDEREKSLIVCTNEYEKGSGDQDVAFERCAKLRDFYQRNKK
jgi:hypothetical protein